MNAPITLPEISPSEAQHPAVVKLLEVLHQQVLIIQQQSETIHGLQEELQRLKDEIAHLKQHKSKPNTNCLFKRHVFVIQRTNRVSYPLPSGHLFDLGWRSG